MARRRVQILRALAVTQRKILVTQALRQRWNQSSVVFVYTPSSALSHRVLSKNPDYDTYISRLAFPGNLVKALPKKKKKKKIEIR